jgi:uncharacterized protein (TIGR02147 family)
LRDQVEYLKITNPDFSLREVSRRAHLAPGFLPMYLKGQRNISGPTASRLIKGFELSSEESRFLQLLIDLASADSVEHRSKLLSRIQKLELYQQKKLSEFEVHQYLRHWHYVAIRELSLIGGFRADPSWIRRRLGGQVSLAQVKEALEFLIRHQYIQQSGDTHHPNQSKDLRCEDGVYRISLAHFHKNMLAKAVESIDAHNAQERVVVGYTVSIPKGDLKKAKKILEDALDSIAVLEAPAATDAEVYHFALAGFPLTETREGS